LTVRFDQQECRLGLMAFLRTIRALRGEAETISPHVSDVTGVERQQVP
jgi:hypothetical protein